MLLYFAQEEPVSAKPTEYKPGKDLHVPRDVQDVFDYVMRYKPTDQKLATTLKPFLPEYICAIGDADAMLKVGRPDGSKETLGVVELDEPATVQSDGELLWMTIALKTKNASEHQAGAKERDSSDASTRLAQEEAQPEERSRVCFLIFRICFRLNHVLIYVARAGVALLHQAERETREKQAAPATPAVYGDRCVILSLFDPFLLCVFAEMSRVDITIQQQSESTKRQFIDAAQYGDVRELVECFMRGANIEEQDSNGTTALLSAAQNRRQQAVCWLIDRNANVNHTNKLGQFALYFAAHTDSARDICDALLWAGADKNMTYEGKTAAQFAAEKGHFELAEFIQSWKMVCMFMWLCVCMYLCMGLCFRFVCRNTGRATCTLPAT